MMEDKNQVYEVVLAQNTVIPNYFIDYLVYQRDIKQAEELRKKKDISQQ